MDEKDTIQGINLINKGKVVIINPAFHFEFAKALAEGAENKGVSYKVIETYWRSPGGVVFNSY